MRILLISDIHGNAAALEAVIEKHRDVDEVWCAGDIVLCGPCPTRCIELVREHCCLVVQGNHDLEYAQAVRANPSLCHDRNEVREEDIEYLLGLPLSITVDVEGATCSIMHNAPAPLTRKLLPMSESEYLHGALDIAGTDIILGGHSHVAMVLRVGERLVVNAGTVGQPRDGQYGAQCMLIEDGSFRFDRVRYGFDRLVRDYEDSSMPAQEQQTWLERTRTGFIDAHGLQRGPFSGTCQLLTPKAGRSPAQDSAG